MNEHFRSEDERKTKLFDGWNAHLDRFHQDHQGQDFRTTFEGMASVTEVTSERLHLELEDGRRIRGLIITPEVARYTKSGDRLYLVLGWMNQRWWVLNVVSVGSLREVDPAEFHLTFNPLYMPPAANAH